jgi:hypothetical protein
MAEPTPKRNILKEDAIRKNADLAARQRIFETLSQSYLGNKALEAQGITQSPAKSEKARNNPILPLLNGLIEQTMLAPETLLGVVGAADAVNQLTGGKAAGKEAEATIVPAKASLKGMKGIHPNYDLDAFLKAEATVQGQRTPTALERKYGIFRTPEGLKTNVSDVGLEFEYGGRDIIWDTTTKDVGKYAPLGDVIRHPNAETINEALSSPVFRQDIFRDIELRRNAADDADGSYYPSDQTIDINSDSIARSPTVRSVGIENNILAVILHELGHGVQQYSGHQGGSSYRLAQKAPEWNETATGVQKLLNKAGNTEQAAEKILNYVRNGGSPVKLSGKSQAEVQGIMNEIITDTVYKAHAGEQSSNAAMKRFLTSTLFKNPEELKTLEELPITSHMTVPVWDQIYNP